MILFSFNNCGVKKPGVENMEFASVGFRHTGGEATCADCHSSARPAAVSLVVHGGGADCVACHTSTNDMGLAADKKIEVWGAHSGTHTHSSPQTTCVNCHWTNRPAAVNGFAHYNRNDCVSCHAVNNTKNMTDTQIIAAFKSTAAYTHPTGLTSCNSCHEKNRPSPTHNAGFDCVSCHKTNNTWTSGMTQTQINTIWRTSL